MKDSWLALISLLVAVCALGTTLFRTPAPSVPVSAAASFPLDLEPRFSSLEASIARLDVAVESLRLSEPSPREPAVPAPEAAAVDPRVVELERQVGELTSMLRNAPPQRAVPAPSDDVRREERQKVIDRWTSTARNATATEAERIEGLRGLRGMQLVDGTDARLGVLPDVIRLAEQSSDERVRADVWRQLHGVNDRSLIRPLLFALQNDPSEAARAEAAESLDVFLGEAEVRRALEYAAEHDASSKVRSDARESLAGGR